METRKLILLAGRCVLCFLLITISGEIMTQPGHSHSRDSLTLRVLTFNVWSGLNYRGTLKMGEYETPEHRQKRYEVLVEQLREVHPDVICLQEVNPAPGYTRRLAKDLGYQGTAFVGMGGIHLGPVGIPVNFREGDAILVSNEFEMEVLGRTKLSGRGISTNWFTFHFAEINQIMGVELRKDGFRFHVYNTHLHAGPGPTNFLLDRLRNLWNSDEIATVGFSEILERFLGHQERRQRELDRALEFIQKHRESGVPEIFAGDFNLTPAEVTYYIPVRDGFQDTYRPRGDHREYTWDPEQNNNIRRYYTRPDSFNSATEYARWIADHRQRRIDYVFVRDLKHVVTVGCTARFGTGVIRGVHPSDHFGWLTTLTISGSLQ